MSDEPYLGYDRDEITFRDVELVLAAIVRTKWPPGTWDAPADQPISLYEILGEALTACGLGDRLPEVYEAARKLAEPFFVEVVKGHEEIRQDVVKKHGQW